MAARDFDLTPHPTTSAAERWSSAECGNFDTERQIRARPHSAATTCCTCPTCRCERFFLWGLIQRDARFPQKKMGCEDHVRVAANDHCFTHRLAFRFKWENGRERFFVIFCRGMVRRRGEELSLDFHTLLRTGIGVESAAPNHPKAPGWNVFESA